MPLILAIEPDRRQAAYLTAVVRRRVGAELILVDTTERALDAIGNRVPELLLVPALLSPQDDAALATALRVIAAAAHVQMLTIPVLGPAQPAARAKGGLLGLRRERSRSAEPDGCDPNVFAEQIASYLERAARERESLTADEVPDESASVAQTAVEAAEVLPAAEIPATIETHETVQIADVVEIPVPAEMAEPANIAAAADEEAVVEPPQPDAAADERVAWAVEDAFQDFFSSVPAEAAPTVEPPADEASPDETSAGEASPDETSAMLPLDEFMAVLEEMQLPTIEASEGGDWAPPTIEDAAERDVIDDDDDTDESDDIDLMANLEGDEDEEPGVQLDAAEMDLGAAEDVPPAAEDATLALESTVEVAEEAVAPPLATVDESIWLAIEAAVQSQFMNVVPVAESRPELESTPMIESSEEPSGAVVEPDESDLWIPLGAATAPVWPDLEVPPPQSAIETVPVVARVASVTPPAKGEREWVELIASLRHDVERLRAEGTKPASPSGPRPPRPTTRKGRAPQDEWGFFDPEQCGFAALVAKLEEVTESDENARV